MSAAECVSEVISVEQENHRAVQVNEQIDKQVAQNFHLDSWLFRTAVRLHISSPPSSPFPIIRKDLCVPMSLRARVRVHACVCMHVCACALVCVCVCVFFFFYFFFFFFFFFIFFHFSNSLCHPSLSRVKRARSMQSPYSLFLCNKCFANFDRLSDHSTL